MGQNRRGREHGSILLVVAVFLATAIAALAGINSSRVVHATRHQRVLEQETRAFNSAYAQIHLAMNVVNNSAYDDQNHNLVLQEAVAALTEPSEETATDGGGEESGYIAVATDKSGTQVVEQASAWISHPDDPDYGIVPATNVRVYHARDYIKRLQRLKGEEVTDVDPDGFSDAYYVLEASGRVGDTIRIISALVRENEPFSSFVFFQNNGTLGISGAPRGLIHSNETLAFYFPNGSYRDGVSAVEGFDFLAGATRDNTSLRDANPDAKRIDLEAVDFEDLRSKANLFEGEPGMNAEIQFQTNGKVRIDVFTPPRFEQVVKTRTFSQYVGYHYETVTVTEQRQVGTTTVEYTVQVVDYYETETYWKWEQVKVGETTETLYREVTTQTGTTTVTKTREEPVYEEQAVTKTRWVKTFVPYDVDGAGGGTTVAGADGQLGEYVWVQESYETTEMVQVDTRTVTYAVEEPVYTTTTEPYTKTTPIYKKQKVTKTRQVPVYKTVTKTREEPVYETVEVQKEVKVNDYETVTEEYTEEVWQHPAKVDTVFVDLKATEGGVIFVDGRITRLHGKVNGRVTVVSTDKIRINGSLLYVDDDGDTAMLNGGNSSEPFQRNPDYDGRSVLGVIAGDDILFTHTLPSQAEIDGTLMSVTGRVGVDGFWVDESTNELVKDSRRTRRKLLTEEERKIEKAYDKVRAYRTKRFLFNSLRRMGGDVSNHRIMSTYIRTRSDGTAYVDSGFKRGNMTFDINLLFNPPPNFVLIPRPVLTYFTPILLVRNHDN